ncbi:MAG: rhomboid family intramembrane serine protease [Chloroflexota bacterium]
MIPVRRTMEREQLTRDQLPLVTYTLVALNILIYFWDRHGNPFGTSMVFADLTMRPREVVGAVITLFGGNSGGHWAGDLGARFPLVTLITAMFLHGGFLHLAGNMLFLTVFGAGVEEALGSWRFALYYLAWGVAAAGAQIWVDPSSSVPVLGASGAIGGALGSYFLLFPASKIDVTIPILAFATFAIPAFWLLGGWFLWQVFAPQEGVASWAHVGGFVAGMLTVLILGGRIAIFRRAGLDPSKPDG